MSFLKSLPLLVVSFSLAAPSYATIIEDTYPWNSETSSANVLYKSSGNDSLKSFSLFIDHSKSGEQRLYFEVDYNFTLVTAPPNETRARVVQLTSVLYPEKRLSTVMVFNGQAIKMGGHSQKYADTRNTYYSYTPETVAGHAYLVNLFKKSKLPIKVDFAGDKLLVPVVGFTKIWNNQGGNAL